MRLLLILGIPFRLLILLYFYVLVGVLEPRALAKIDYDFTWVVTGVGKSDRNGGRQLI